MREPSPPLLGEGDDDGETARVESTAAVKTTIPLVWLIFVGVVLSAPMRSAEAEESRRQPGAFAAV
jgi:hypothetical protein